MRHGGTILNIVPDERTRRERRVLRAREQKNKNSNKNTLKMTFFKTLVEHKPPYTSISKHADAWAQMARWH